MEAGKSLGQILNYGIILGHAGSVHDKPQMGATGTVCSIYSSLASNLQSVGLSIEDSVPHGVTHCRDSVQSAASNSGSKKFVKIEFDCP